MSSPMSNDPRQATTGEEDNRSEGRVGAPGERWAPSPRPEEPPAGGHMRHHHTHVDRETHLSCPDVNTCSFFAIHEHKGLLI
jgi:hypothetical protein